MLRPKKKLSRKEIKQDKLITTYFRVYDKLYNYRKHLIVLLVIVVAGALGAILYHNNVQAENQRAMTELGKVYPLYDQGQYHQAIHGSPEQNLPGLSDIVRNYGSTDAGRLATFYLANAYYHNGDYDNAYRYFDMFRGSDPLLRASALAGKAAIHEIRGEPAQAAELFEQAATRFGATAITPENLKHAGRNYLEAGMHGKALSMFERLQNEFPESAYAREVDRYLAQISVTSE
jgi:tetratricopeptide (TPR) repeat protein